MKSAPVIASLLFFLTWSISSDPLILRARQSEKAGAYAGSAALFSSWLVANPGAPGSAEVFASYIRVQQDLPELLDTSEQFLETGKGVPGAAVQFERIARLFDLAGRIEEARNAYLAAHAEGGQDAALVSAFLLSLQMNDTDAMALSLREIATTSTGSAAVLLLRALSDLHSGNQAAARATLLVLADQTGNPDLALKSLWILYQWAATSGDPAGQSAARARLGSRFKTAPETALAAAPSLSGSKPNQPMVVQLPTPIGVDDGSAPDGAAVPSPTPTPPTPTADPAPTAPAPVPTAPAPTGAQGVSSSPLFSVQAGSFLMKENADDLLGELTRRGFSPVVVHETAQGKDRYRVLAGTGLESEAGKAVLKKLSEQGFRGFLVAEK